MYWYSTIGSAARDRDEPEGWKDADSYEDYPKGGGAKRRSRSPSNGSVGYSDDSTPSDSEPKYHKPPTSAKFTDKQETVIKTTTTKTEHRRTTKKVDLGAAAHYTGDAVSATPTISAPPPQIQTTTNNSADLLNDLFTTQQDTTRPNIDMIFGAEEAPQSSSADFADFSSAPTPTSQPAGSAATQQQQQQQRDDFADFTSFSQPQAPQPADNFDPFAALSASSLDTPQPPSAVLAPTPQPIITPQQPSFPQQSNQDLLSGFQMHQPAAAMMQPQINPMMSYTSTASVRPTTNSAAIINKANLWSDVKGVNISLDTLGKPEQKQVQPTMNQLQGIQSPQGLPGAMFGMNLNGNSPSMMQQQQGMLTSQQPGMMMSQQHNMMMGQNVGHRQTYGMQQQMPGMQTVPQNFGAFGQPNFMINQQTTQTSMQHQFNMMSK